LLTKRINPSIWAVEALGLNLLIRSNCPKLDSLDWFVLGTDFVHVIRSLDGFITRPLWKILDNPEISVTDMSLYYKKLHDIIENLVQDASPIMNENFQIFYIYPPEKQLFGFSELHVINNDNEELDVLTTLPKVGFIRLVCFRN
jgi:hypothetical protein